MRHAVSRRGTLGLGDDDGGDARDGLVRGHVLEDDGGGGDLRAFSHGDASENLRPRSEQNACAHDGMAGIAFFLARAT